MSRVRVRAAGAVLIIVVLALSAAGIGYLETRAARTPVAPQVSDAAGASEWGRATSPPPAATDPSAGRAPTSQGVGRALAGPLTAPVLGPRPRAEVVDVGTGHVLLNVRASLPAAPASTAKLLTAAAILRTRGPDYRIATTVRAGASGTLVLVGGGDPTLSGAARSVAPDYPGAARISDLAAQLRRRHVTARRIVVDDAAFTGPTVSPAWDAEDVPSSYGAAITAVLADGGRAAPGDAVRSARPDLAAGRELAVALGRPKLPVVRGTAPTKSRTLAVVQSAPVSELLAQMLQQSDNVIAECLARQVAIATGGPASFAGAAHAVRTVVSGLGANPGGGMLDGSGLAAADRVPVAALAGVLRLAADGGHPELGSLLSGLPVAGWSGTLLNRYLTGSSRSGAGVVRAKTGTLTGVSALAGVVHDRSGRLLAFAFVADDSGATPRVEAALDNGAAVLARCGC